MKLEFTLPGFEEQKLALEVRFPLHPRLWVNRKVVKSTTGKWNEIALRRDDGLTSIVYVQNQFPDPVPQLEMDEEIYQVVAPFTWGQRIWALLPMLLIVMAIMDPIILIYGVIIAFVATYINFWVLRVQAQKLERNLTIFAVTTAAAAVFFIIRFLMIRSQIGL